MCPARGRVIVTLDLLPVGDTACVVALRGDPLLRERLAELGFTRGTAVHVVRKAPLGDPLHVRVRSGSFAVRAEEARCVEVSVGDAA
jgi:ferrous iron transport protein A